MDANLKKIEFIKFKRTIKNLKKNHINAVYVASKEEALKLVKNIVSKDSVTTNGGTISLVESGVLDYLEKNTNYINRNEPNLSGDEIRRRELLAFDADYYFASANAVTEHGELYFVDGKSNRIAALSYGPKNIILIIGKNKIVTDLKEAVERVKRIAAPANCTRLDIDSPCEENGICFSPKCTEDNLMYEKTCPNTICCNTLIMGNQRNHDRITAILVGEELGY